MQDQMRLLQSPPITCVHSQISKKTLFLASFLPALLLVALCASSAAQAQTQDQVPSAATTLAIFTDATASPMPDELWPALVATLREELASGSPELQALTGINAGAETQIIRGDQIAPGLAVNNSVTVYLHGECKIVPHPSPIFFDGTQVSGALGWVQRDHGHIEPFVHVECGRLAQMLATRAFGRNQDQRNQLMAAAIARVVLHEWIHIATQNPHHSERGITKAQFGVADLLAHSPKPIAPHGTRWRIHYCDSVPESDGLPALNSLSQACVRGTK